MHRLFLRTCLGLSSSAVNFSVAQVGLGKTVKTDVHVSTVENVTILLENATVLPAGRYSTCSFEITKFSETTQHF